MSRNTQLTVSYGGRGGDANVEDDVRVSLQISPSSRSTTTTSAAAAALSTTSTAAATTSATISITTTAASPAVAVAAIAARYHGFTILSLVAKVYKPMKELWGICRPLDAVVPRGIELNTRLPEDITDTFMQIMQQRDNTFNTVESDNKLLEVRDGGNDVSNDDGDDDDDSSGSSKRKRKESRRFFPISKVYLGVAVLADGEKKRNSLWVKITKARKVEIEFQTGGQIMDFMTMLPSDLIELQLGRYFDQAIHCSSSCSSPSLPTSPSSVAASSSSSSSLPPPPTSPAAQILTTSRLPTGLQKLIFGCEFNQPLPLHALPTGLKELTFGAYFNQPDVILPNGLEEVTFGTEFDQPIKLPEGLKKVTFDLLFEQELVDLPKGLQILDLSRSRRFNYPIKLPVGLKALYFGDDFNQAVQLPNGLLSAYFPDHYAHDVTLAPQMSRVRFATDFSKNVHLSVGDENWYIIERDSRDVQYLSLSRC